MQYFLKCSSCRELIPVKSEYMVMCPVCQKKLKNNYREWLKKSPNSTYAEYLSEVCVSQTAMGGLVEQRQLTRKIGVTRNFKRLAIALAIALVATIGLVGGYYFYKDSQKGAAINTILNEGWKMKYYDDLGVTLKFPYELKLQHASVDSVISADSTQIILNNVVRSWSHEGVTAVNALRIEYEPALGVNREVATQQILQSIIQENDMKAFESIPSDYSMEQGTKARMFTGSYLIKAEPYEFRAVMVVRKDIVWYFMVAYPRSMPEGTLLAEKFFKSILI